MYTRRRWIKTLGLSGLMLPFLGSKVLSATKVVNSLKTDTEKAINIALENAIYGNVLILFPNAGWISNPEFKKPWGNMCSHSLSMARNRCGNYIFTRSSKGHASLKSVAVSTLIIVGKCNEQGVNLAKERLRGSLNKKLIYVP